MTNENAGPGPDAILQLGFGFAGSKVLLSAVELGLFTMLAAGPLTGKALMANLGLQQRGTIDFLDALVSLDMLERSGDEYANAAATDAFLDRNKPSYLGGLLEMTNARACTRSGDRSARRCVRAIRRTRPRWARTSSPPCTRIPTV